MKTTQVRITLSVKCGALYGENIDNLGYSQKKFWFFISVFKDDYIMIKTVIELNILFRT